jgi:superfamily II DNA or RNA helicase
MLTLNGYRVQKNKVSVEKLRKVLTVKPYIPKVFMPNANSVPRYKVYMETSDWVYVPKHYGIEHYGPPAETTRDVATTDAKYWEFRGQMRPNQMEVVNSFLKPEPHDGIISLHTGGGKTVCALYIASQLRLPTLVIVHNSFLRDQWVDRVKTFLPNARIGRIQGEIVEVEGYDVIIAMLQTLSMKDLDISTFKPLGLVIVDECHHIASEVFVQAIPKVTSKYMMGLSATPTRKDGLMFVANWCLGPLLYQSKNLDSEDSSIQVEVYEYKNDDPAFNEIIYNKQGVMFTTLMINKLTEHPGRTKWLAEILGDILDESPQRQVLVLTDRVQHTKDLLAAVPDALREKSCILSQDVAASKRAEFCASKTILIATYAMCKEGFDVPTLNTLLMATPRPDIDQIVGRILRVEKSARTIHPLILDIVDPQFRRQFQERNSLYKKRCYTVTKMELPPTVSIPPSSIPTSVPTWARASAPPAS